MTRTSMLAQSGMLGPLSELVMTISLELVEVILNLIELGKTVLTTSPKSASTVQIVLVCSL